MFGFKVICWALLFIFKLRFPPGVSIATVLNTKPSYKLKRNIHFQNWWLCNVNFRDLFHKKKHKNEAAVTERN
jgi:hypothetical protein